MTVERIQRGIIDNNIVDFLTKKFNITSETAKILSLRGICDEKSVNDFLYPNLDMLSDPFLINGVFEAKQRIEQAISKKESIVIYGDYDCDGVCAVSILYNYLKLYIPSIHYYVPNRREDGYGLHNITIDGVIDSFKPDLLITVDCGITSYDEVEYIKASGVDVIVTDHHEPREKIPNCIVVNPKLQNDIFNQFCGAGVALKIVEALGGRQIVSEFICYAAIATIADIVPLIGENRIIAKIGLEKINKKDSKAARIFMDKMNLQTLSSGDVMYKLAPRLNAAGRMGDASKTVEYFISDNENLMCQVIESTEIDNQNRQKLTDEITKSVLKKLKKYDLVKNRFIILYDKEWDSGVLGIVAARISELYWRPVLLFSETEDNILRGSARSIQGISVFECLSEFSNYFESFGGHSAAAGVSIKKENFDRFFKDINVYLNNNYEDKCFYPHIDYDIQISTKDCTMKLLDELEMLEPTGFGNPKPIFMLENLDQTFLQIGNKPHIKAKVGDLELLGFNLLSSKKNIDCPSYLFFTLSSSTFRNNRFAQGIIKHYVPFDPIDCLDEEKIAFYYLRQILLQKFDKKAPAKVYNGTIDDDNTLYGNLYIAFNSKTFVDFIRQSEKEGKFLLSNFSQGLSTNPYNRIILCMDKTYDFSAYKNIILLDKPLNENYIGWLQANSNATIYCIEGKNANLDNIRKFRCQDFDKYNEIYAFLRNNTGFNVIEVFAMSSELKQNGIGYFQFATGFYIFLELGVIKLSKNFNMEFVKGIKYNLADSALFNILNSL